MKLFKISMLVVMFSCIFVIMLGCNTEGSAPVTTDFKPVEEFPDFTEFNKLAAEDLVHIEHAIINNNAEDAKKYFKKKLEKYFDEKGILAVTSIDVAEDKLMMHSNENIRIFNDLFVDLSIEWDVAQLNMEEQQRLLEEMSEEIRRMFFDGDVFALYRLNKFDASITKLQSGVTRKISNIDSGMKYAFNVKLSKEELAAQTLTYKTVRKNMGFLLRKFGVPPDTKELYIEIYIQEWYNKKGKNVVVTEEDIQEIVDKTQDISNTLYNNIVSNKDGENLIKNQGLDAITITFYSKFLEEGSVTYSFDIEP